jgi:ATP-dependent RNA helicase SUPV3L1/SUV3
MERLKTVKSGVYCGPLRLLAHEIYERLNHQGVTCNLITGEEKRVLPHVDMFSCTVEMTPLNRQFQVAVIDEIQMLEHDQRGWGWTNAFFGLQAEEIHVCGEASAVPLIRKLCDLTGDEMEVFKHITQDI